MIKRFLVMAATVPLLALAVRAQDEPERVRKMKAELDTVMGQMKVVGLAGAAMGATVKGAPYSAVEVSESSQTLADGTRIHNENRTSVYRDSEGRVRRETPSQITILDPVAGVSYFLDPNKMTARKATLAMPAVYKRMATGGGFGGGGMAAAGPIGGEAGAVAFSTDEKGTFEVSVSKSGAGTATVTVNGKPVDPSTLATDHVFVNGEPVDEKAFAIAQDKMKAEMAVMAGSDGVLRHRITSPGQAQSLGTQMMEGVNAEGTRLSTKLDTGAIGNDRPIEVINERWYSPELKTIVMTKHSDPRSGEDTFRLINISRAEPGTDLFQVPTNYQILDRK